MSGVLILGGFLKRGVQIFFHTTCPAFKAPYGTQTFKSWYIRDVHTSGQTPAPTRYIHWPLVPLVGPIKCWVLRWFGQIFTVAPSARVIADDGFVREFPQKIRFRYYNLPTMMLVLRCPHISKDFCCVGIRRLLGDLWKFRTFVSKEGDFEKLR